MFTIMLNIRIFFVFDCMKFQNYLLLVHLKFSRKKLNSAKGYRYILFFIFIFWGVFFWIFLVLHLIL